ncbi:hypothetical protein B9T31_02010 [Acinetobacter sp. ANC 4558]|uniref:hypothetical protein n=1 Tax=Acinetobacter sp. ANC 4558 TaxID=1977876 RepID=UPI000A34DE13|nr:hypothetical protein [Acinetobacter sp. ANC 4558]OTG88315.1 hypothetical protein B9T31_02010 [Acinetobacter sp. ANC 4558]
MEVVAYLNNSDLLLEDEHGVAVIGGSSYVLSVGDKVFIQNPINTDAKVYSVKISFAHVEHCMLHDDEIQIKFEGCHESLKSYVQKTTVH